MLVKAGITRRFPDWNEFKRVTGHTPEMEEILLAPLGKSGRLTVAQEEEVLRLASDLAETFMNVYRQLSRIWYCLDWMQSGRLANALEAEILALAVHDFFYSYWNMCGKVLNEAFDLGENFKESAPSFAKLLRKHKDKDKVFEDLAKIFNAEIQERIVGIRHQHIHRNSPEFGELLSMTENCWVANEPDQAGLLLEGFYEIYDSYQIMRKRCVEKTREFLGDAIDRVNVI
ncbi:MAG: Cthe_2314 family HEPN domain-containing protein [candidate division Zixibacteria bacterium]|nr:Cthe_2314 family HEPN domain-containing protein [candidate division Zixibacteria bacterium]